MYVYTGIYIVSWTILLKVEVERHNSTVQNFLQCFHTILSDFHTLLILSLTVENEANVARAGEADVINGIEYLRSLGPATDTSSNALLSSLMPILSGRKSQLLTNELRKIPGGGFASSEDKKDTGGDDKSLTSSGKGRMATAATRRFTAPRTVAERINLAQRFYRLYSLFSGANGSVDVWEGVLALLNDMASNEADTKSDAITRGDSTKIVPVSSSIHCIIRNIWFVTT
jgi:hypothetical protein